MIMNVQGAGWEAVERDGRVEAVDGGNVALAWQARPLVKPVGGGRFAASAFLHPLRTPSGFGLTTIQPADHLHHFGVWWPWKFIEVGGKRSNSWEIQEGQAALVAKGIKVLKKGPDELEWEFANELEVRGGGEARPVIAETARVGIAKQGPKAYRIDVSLKHDVVGEPVNIPQYHYSGFSWRGPASWNKDNSTMLASGGHGRDNANGQEARWVVVSGPTPAGRASMLLMSAAGKNAGAAERLRVWDSNSYHGTPFVNFNPVVQAGMSLDKDHPAVSFRQYRIIAADFEIDAKAAEAEWGKWMKN